MTRVRWLEATWPFSMRTLASRLKRYSLSPESDDGFLLERTRDQFIEGTYFERVAIDEVIRDPFGNETRFERVIYREVQFVFSSEYPQVELRKFPRTLHAFLSRMSEASDFGVALAPITVDALVWAQGVQRTHPKAFQLDLAQLSEVFIEDGVSARVIMASREDVRGAYQRFTAQRKHAVDRVQIKMEHDGSIIGLQLSADATMRTLDALPTAILQDLRLALPPPKPL